MQITNDKRKERNIITNAPNGHQMHQARRLKDDRGNVLRYVFLELQGGRIIKTDVDSLKDSGPYIVEFQGNILDFQDNVLGKVEAEINCALKSGTCLTSYR